MNKLIMEDQTSMAEHGFTENRTSYSVLSEAEQMVIRSHPMNNQVHTQCSIRSKYRSPGLLHRRLRRRAVFKNGECNIMQVHVPKKNRKYFQDLFTTMVDVKWRWTFMAFALSFLGSWTFFAIIWWMIAITHGDLETVHEPDWVPCVLNINGFVSCFLYSMEVQTTIGFGGRVVTEECPEGVFMMVVQTIVGMMIQAFMVGFVFAKMARPKQRTQTLLFSRYAVISLRDGNLCLMFRVGDMREKSHFIGASIKAELIRPHATKEGEYITPFLCELKLQADESDSDLFMIWPNVVYHVIDETSPLYNMNAADIIHERFEIIVILEGTTESTGQTSQARTSYLPSEILWGHRFQPLVNYNKEKLTYLIDYSLFHNTYQVDTPLCSAHEMKNYSEIQRQSPVTFN